MALTTPSLFLYGYRVTQYNSSLDFRAVAMGPVLTATLRQGFYSLTGLMVEVARSMRAVDPGGRYVVTADRTVNGGRENRVTIATVGSHLELLFQSGPRAASTIAPLLGHAPIDRTGGITYTGASTSGTSFVTERAGHNFLEPEFYQGPQGVTNISGSGLKEAIVYGGMVFSQVQFKYIERAFARSAWSPFLIWATFQRSFEFTPEISQPDVFHNVTLESTAEDSKGMRFKMTEMLPTFPNLYDTGLLKFRINN